MLDEVIRDLGHQVIFSPRGRQLEGAESDQTGCHPANHGARLVADVTAVM